MIRAVAFDLDDTLAVTGASRETLLEDAAARANVDLTFDREAYLDAHREHSGTRSRRPVFEALVEDEAAEPLTLAYREAIGEALTPVEAAGTLLATLRGRYRVGLLTDGPEETQRDKLRRLGWDDEFDTIVVTGSIEAPKPEARAFVALTERLGVDAAETVFVGDHPERDIAGAAAAGLVAVQVLYEGGPEPHPDAIATVRRDDLVSLPRLLERLGDRPDDA